MRVAIACNTLPSGYARESGDDTFAEFDSPDTVEAIKNALLHRCRSIFVVEANEDAYERLKNGNFDLVFNVAEGIRGEARECHMPAMLEMLKIPYTGSGITTLALTLDKRRTKEILLANGIRTPSFQVVESAKDLRPGLVYPLFVKPNCEGSSRGITARSLVNSENELKEMVSKIADAYHQPVLVEEYLPGQEFTVAIVGNSPPRVLPIVEVSFDSLPEGAPRFDCYEVKWIYDSLTAGCDTTFCPARIDEDLKERIEDASLRTFQALGIRDLCRIDLRLDREGEPSIIEVNALPGLIPDPRENSRFPKAAYAAGYSYEELIGAVFDAALEREGLA